MSTTRDNTLTTIARQTLDLETLDTRKRDALDFHDIAVWSIKEALEQAYEAGRQAARPRQATCPACGKRITIKTT